MDIYENIEIVKIYVSEFDGEIEKARQHADRAEDAADSILHNTEQTTAGEIEETTAGEIEETTAGEIEETTAGEIEETTAGEIEETTAGEIEETTAGEIEETTAGEIEETTAGEIEETTAGEIEETTAGEIEETTAGDTMDYSLFPDNSSEGYLMRNTGESTENSQIKDDGTTPPKAPGFKIGNVGDGNYIEIQSDGKMIFHGNAIIEDIGKMLFEELSESHPVTTDTAIKFTINGITYRINAEKVTP